MKELKTDLLNDTCKMEDTTRNTEKSRNSNKKLMKWKKKHKLSTLPLMQTSVVNDIIETVTSDLGILDEGNCSSVQFPLPASYVVEILSAKHKKSKKRKISTDMNDQRKPKKKKKKENTDISNAETSMVCDSSFFPNSSMLVLKDSPESASQSIYTLPPSPKLEASLENSTSFLSSTEEFVRSEGKVEVFSRSESANSAEQFSTTSGVQNDYINKTSFPLPNDLHENQYLVTGRNELLSLLDVTEQSPILESNGSLSKSYPISFCDKSNSTGIHPPSVVEDCSTETLPSVTTKSQFLDNCDSLQLAPSSSSLQNLSEISNVKNSHLDCEDTRCSKTVIRSVQDFNGGYNTVCNGKLCLPMNVSTSTDISSEALQKKIVLPDIILPDISQILDNRQREQLEYWKEMNTEKGFEIQLMQKDISSTQTVANHEESSSVVDQCNGVEGVSENTQEIVKNNILTISSENQTNLYNTKSPSTLQIGSQQQLKEISVNLEEHRSSSMYLCFHGKKLNRKKPNTGQEIMLWNGIHRQPKETVEGNSKEIIGTKYAHCQLSTNELENQIGNESQTVLCGENESSVLLDEIEPCTSELCVVLDELPSLTQEAKNRTKIARASMNSDKVVIPKGKSDNEILVNKPKNIYKHISVRSFKNFSQIIFTKTKNPKLHPDKRMKVLHRDHNFLDALTLKELARAFSNLQSDDTCHAILLSSVGSTFCSGINPLELLNWKNENMEKKNILFLMRRFLNVLINFTKPLVAVVSGPAIDFGASILLFCDVVYASDRASFQWAHLKQGLVPFGCVTQLLPTIVGKANANSLLFGQRAVTANEAKCMGLVSEVFPHDSLMKHVFPFCREMSSSLLSVLCMTKKLLNNVQKSTLQKAMVKEHSLLVECLTLEQNRDKINSFMNYLVG